MVADWACSLGVTLVEIPASNPTYTLSSTVTRFPPQALKDALLSQVQQMIPLIKIQPLQSGYPAIYLSDRRCTIGAQLYLPRLVDFDGISQGMGNEADDATFTFGNADRVMRDLANDVDLFRAAIEFSLSTSGSRSSSTCGRATSSTGSSIPGAEFKVTAADGLYELNLPYPTRKISRTCWKAFNVGRARTRPRRARSGPLPVRRRQQVRQGIRHRQRVPGARHEALLRRRSSRSRRASRIKDNSTGVFGFGRSSITSVSLVADSIYDQVIPEIYTDSEMPVNCKVAAGRDESDFYEALGIVGEGPLDLVHRRALRRPERESGRHGHTGSGLRRQHARRPGAARLAQPTTSASGRSWAPIRRRDGDWFSLDQSGNTTGGDWRKVYSGNSTFKDNFAAGTAFIVIRRSDAKGLQLSKPGDHAMIAYVQMGMSGWVWTSPGVRVYGPRPGEPGLDRHQHAAPGARPPAGRERHHRAVESRRDVLRRAGRDRRGRDLQRAVTKMVGAGSETQFKFRGMLQEEKPLRDWLQEVLMNCLGYYTFSFGKLKIGMRENSSTVEAFTVGNIVFNSPPIGSAQAVVQPPHRQLRGPGLHVRQQLGRRLRHRPRHAAGRRRGSAVPEIQRQPLRHLHQVAGGADHQHPAARGVGRHQRRGVEGRAPVGRSGPRCWRSTPSREWSAR